MIIDLSKCLVKGCPETSHRWEWNGPTMQELLRIQETLGMDPDHFTVALGTASTGITIDGAKAVIMMVNILHRRNGHIVAFEETDVALEELEAILDPAPAPAEPEGKDATTTSPRPAGGEADSSTSGPSAEAASAPKSSPTPATSGGSTG